MPAIREPGKVNENTTLIDIGMYGVKGVTAVYLIQGTKKCLIDGGTRTEASRIIRSLKELNAFPPDIVIVTHSHWDHTQAIPALRKEAAKEQKEIEVMASQKAVPLLEDQSFNKVFDSGPYQDIDNVIPLREGDTIDLGATTLKIYEVPGHTVDHIAILDEKNENIFVGDAIGDKIVDTMFIPPFMPPFWDPEAFSSSLNKLRHIDYEGLCLAHFGYIYGNEAKSILDEAASASQTWWQLFETNADRLDDPDYMLEIILKETNLVPTNPEIISLKLRVLFRLTTAGSRLLRKRPRPLSEILLRSVVEQLTTGYRTYIDQTSSVEAS